MSQPIDSNDAADKTINAIQAKIGQSPNSPYYASKLDSMGAHASPLQRQRFDVAVAYLEHHHSRKNAAGLTEVDRDAVLRHLKGIDFHSDVKITKIETGTNLRQSNFNRLGSYFTTSGYPSQQLGITDGHAPNLRTSTDHTVNTHVVALESRCCGVVDTFSDSRMVRNAPTHTPSGNKIINGDSRNAFQPVTTQAHQARSSFKRTIDPNNQSVIEHNSGEYAYGGGRQFYLAPQYHSQLSPTKRDQSIRLQTSSQSLDPTNAVKQAPPVPAQKRGIAR